VWVISKNDELPNEPFDKPVSYGSPFYLLHKASGNKLDMDKRYKSPATKQAEGIIIILFINFHLLFYK
jgi:hypothetical protein